MLSSQRRQRARNSLVTILKYCQSRMRELNGRPLACKIQSFHGWSERKRSTAVQGDQVFKSQDWMIIWSLRVKSPLSIHVKQST